MGHSRLWFVWIAMALLGMVFGCEEDPDVYYSGPDPIDQWFDSTLPTEGSLEFTAFPLDQEEMLCVYPLGLMGSHTFPSDHIYLDHTEGATVYAPSAGKILYIAYAMYRIFPADGA